MPSAVLGVGEDVVPEPRLQVALHLGQVEVRPAAALEQLRGVVEEVEAEVDQRADRRLAVDRQVPLVQVPAARAASRSSAYGPSLSSYVLPSVSQA